MGEISCLNPIFDYAAKGQLCEKRGEWEKAVCWYHRALACFPNHFGTGKEIRQPPRIKSSPVVFTEKHASRMYGALGLCLMELDRSQDSHLAFQAAHCLDPENIPAQRYMRAAKQILEADAVRFDAKGCVSEHGLPPPKRDLEKSLTLIMVTHCTNRLQKFKVLSPPSSKLVTATYGSLLKVFGDEVRRCSKIIGYDTSSKGTARSMQYARSLERFACNQGFELHTYPGIGLFNVLNRIVATVTTPYILFVEHDWLFQGPRIRLDAIVDMMDRDPKMHSVRFNKRDNFINGQDYIVQAVASPVSIPTLRTSAFSNNPSVIRTDKLKGQWLPLCEQALQRVSGELGGSAFGIEEILFKHQVESVRHQGFDRAHAQWGTFIFGGVGEPRRIIHLGE